MTLGVGRRQRWFLLGNDDDDDTDGCVGDAPGRLGLWLVDVWLGDTPNHQCSKAVFWCGVHARASSARVHATWT